MPATGNVSEKNLVQTARTMSNLTTRPRPNPTTSPTTSLTTNLTATILQRTSLVDLPTTPIIAITTNPPSRPHPPLPLPTSWGRTVSLTLTNDNVASTTTFAFIVVVLAT